MFGLKMTVREAIDSEVRFDRVKFVNKELEGKTWLAGSFYPTNEELVRDYGDNICQQSIVKDDEGFNKYSLLVWVNPNDKHLIDNFFLE